MAWFKKKSIKQQEKELDKKILAEEVKVAKESVMEMRRSKIEEKKKVLSDIRKQRFLNSPVGKVATGIQSGLKSMGESSKNEMKGKKEQSPLTQIMGNVRGEMTQNQPQNPFGSALERENGRPSGNSNPFMSPLEREGQMMQKGKRMTKMSPPSSGLRFHY